MEQTGAPHASPAANMKTGASHASPAGYLYRVTPPALPAISCGAPLALGAQTRHTPPRRTPGFFYFFQVRWRMKRCADVRGHARGVEASQCLLMIALTVRLAMRALVRDFTCTQLM